MPGRSRTEYWESVARKIQRRFHTRFTGQQCERKWRNLVRDFNVSKIIIVINKKQKKLIVNIFRISVSGGTEHAMQGGQEMVKDTIGSSVRGSGINLVITN